jgi:DNA polymerase-4
VIIAHLDMDAFFASVEELENPELQKHPLVVGGDPDSRGVVSTANYLARQYGIHSGMPSNEARKLCPQAVFVRPRGDLYRRYSDRVWSIVEEIVPEIEKLGLDEGYLELSSVARSFNDAVELAASLQRQIKRKTKLTCSIGVATSKVVAKIASDRQKPEGLTAVAPGAEAEFLSPLPVRLLPGVGPRTEERLLAAEVDTLGLLADLTDEALLEVLPGKTGEMLRARARGIDPRPLETIRERLSIGHEETFAEDISSRAVLHNELRRMTERVVARLREKGMSARTISTKVRYSDFDTRSRSTTLPLSIDDTAAIADHACLLLDYALAAKPGPLRLLGVSVSNLSQYTQLTLPI